MCVCKVSAVRVALLYCTPSSVSYSPEERRAEEEKHRDLYVQTIHPDGRVVAARRCSDEEQTPGPNGEPPRHPRSHSHSRAEEEVEGMNEKGEAGNEAEANEAGSGSGSGSGSWSWSGSRDDRWAGRRGGGGDPQSPASYDRFSLQQLLMVRWRFQQRDEQLRIMDGIELERRERVARGNNAPRRSSSDSGGGDNLLQAGGQQGDRITLVLPSITSSPVRVVRRGPRGAGDDDELASIV